MTHYKFVFPPRNDKIDFVRVFEGSHVDLELVATGVPEPLTIAPNNPAIARAASVPATGAALKVNVRVTGLSGGGSHAHVMLEARNSKKEVVAFTQIIVFPHNSMVVSPAGVHFVAKEEGFVPHLYN